MFRDLGIFVQSSDLYSDIWNIFFIFFKKNFSHIKKDVYLNTHQKEFNFKGFNIISTKVGNCEFGEHFKKGLNKVKEKYVLFITIDSIIKKKVNKKSLENCFKFIKKNNLDAIYLINQNYKKILKTKNKKIGRICLPTKDSYSMQIAIWKKETLKKILLNHETTWALEWFGTKRCNVLNLKLATINNKKYDVFYYDKEGFLVKGLWTKKAIKFLKKNKISLNFKKRGIYNEDSYFFKLITRIRMKYLLVKSGLKGSYIFKRNVF